MRWMLNHWTGRKGPVTCFKCLLLYSISKRHIVWWEYITSQGCKDLTFFKNFFIHSGQMQPSVYHHAVSFHVHLQWLLIEHIQSIIITYCFSAVTPRVILYAPWVKNIWLCISIQCFTAVTRFQCFFIHPWSNILIRLSLLKLQRGGSAASLFTPAQLNSAAYHFLLFTSVTSSSTSLSNTPVVSHHLVLPSCDTNCFIIQAGKIHPVVYQSQRFSAVPWFKCLFIHSLKIHTL